jgi:hypothetical protein
LAGDEEVRIAYDDRFVELDDSSYLKDADARPETFSTFSETSGARAR